MKKKILITTGVSTLAVVAGVTPSVISNTNSQSTIVDDLNPTNPTEPVDPTDPTNPDPTNPTEPVDPSEPSKTDFATIPTSDVFSYKIENFHSLGNEELDEFFQKLFSETDFFEEFKTSFKNNNEYTDVIIAYKINSASDVDSYFELLVTPIEGKTWSDDSTNSKTVKVSINNIEEADAEAPKMGQEISYDVEIDGTNIKTDSDLNNYLLNLFENVNEFENLTIPESSLSFKNVDVNYLSDSANFEDKTFKISVSPKDGHRWSDAMESDVTFSSYEILVKITNFVASKIINDAKAPQSLNFTASIDSKGMDLSSDLNSWLGKYFSNNSNYLSSFVPVGGSGKLENVEVTFQRNSGNLTWKTFKVNVKPIEGHAWENGEQDAITLNVNITNFISQDKLIEAPVSFNSDLIINSQYDYANGYSLTWNNINKFLDPNFSIVKYVTNREYWDSQAATYQKTFAEQTFKNFANYYPNVEISSYTLGTISKDEFKGFVTKFTFNAVIKPKTNYFWKDKTNTAKTIPISFFCANLKNGAPSIGQYSSISDLTKLTTDNWVNSAPTKSWVSKTLFNASEFDRTYAYGAVYRKLNFEECRELIWNHAYDELIKSFPRYLITPVTDPYSIKNGDSKYLYAPWRFKISMKSMDNPTNVFQIDCYVMVKN